jgi:hypothetical protein
LKRKPADTESALRAVVSLVDDLRTAGSFRCAAGTS